jgi:hypothetical protein
VLRRTAALLTVALVGLLSCSSGSAPKAAPKPTVSPPTLSPPATTTTTIAPWVQCVGTTLHVTGSGANTGPNDWYVDVRNDDVRACAVPFPTAATAIDDSGERVGLAGFDQVAGPGPYVEPGGSARLVMSSTTACVRGAPADRHYDLILVTLGGTALDAPHVDLVLCGQGVTAVSFGSTTAPEYLNHPLNGSTPILGWLPIGYHVTSSGSAKESLGDTRLTTIIAACRCGQSITVQQWTSDNAQRIVQRFVDGTVRTDIRGWTGYTKNLGGGLGALVWSEGEFIAIRISGPRTDLIGVANGLRPSKSVDTTPSSKP